MQFAQIGLGNPGICAELALSELACFISYARPAIEVPYVLSGTSNAKDGPLKELYFAQGVAKREKLKDFVIPLHIDDLPHGDITIEITRINTVPFAKSWGAGLAKLLEQLEEDGGPPRTRNSTGLQ